MTPILYMPYALTNSEKVFFTGTCALKDKEKRKEQASGAKSVPKLDRDLTVTFVAEKILDHFPTLSSEKSNFLQENRKFVDTLCSGSSQDITNELIKLTPTVCQVCPSSFLKDWPFKAKTAYFLSMGHLKEINIPVRMCLKCKRAYYPQGDQTITFKK
jgi:hypothetical protein